jgi:uncharacterized protein (DUF433 family)
MTNVVDLLNRPMYGLAQTDRLLGLRPGTARRWVDGYRRSGKDYEPVVREVATGEDIITWGEFVETRLLSEYRDAGVPLIRMRPVVVSLRQELQTRYPLASARTWLAVSGRDLVLKVQEEVGLERRLALVVLRTGQVIWTDPAEAFRRSLEWTKEDHEDAEPRLVRPDRELRRVVIDPLRGFGEPVVRSVRTEIIGELFSAGESPRDIASEYELDQPEVEEAIRYEMRRLAPAEAA